MSTPNGNLFSKRLRALRGARSKAEFARFLGLLPPVYQRYEEGRKPKADILSVMAEKLGVTIEWLLGSEDSNYSARGVVDIPPHVMAPLEHSKPLAVREDSSEYSSAKPPTPGKDLTFDFQRLEKMVADVAAELSKMRRKMEGGQ